MWPFDYFKRKKQRQQAFDSKQKELAKRQKTFKDVDPIVRQQLQGVIELWENKFQVILWQRGKCQIKPNANFGDMMAWSLTNVYNQKQHEVLHVSLIGMSHFQILLVPGRSTVTSSLSEAELRQALRRIIRE
jgi:RecB family endonuclease NucS